MANPTAGLFDASHRVNWVRLRTLIVLRWIAIAGQLAAITVAQRLFDLDLELGLAFLAIGASITANLIAIFVYPENKRLTEVEAAMHLVFDIVQLSFLLYLTGGLHNPFALLMLVPVTVSAMALRAKTTVAIGGLAIVLVTLLAELHVPLRTDAGVLMRLPAVFVLGFWVAIVIGVIFLSAFAQRVTSEVYTMSDALAATQMALAREQKLTDLGGVVAAAAHELGTPLATIKLVSSELIEELADRPELREDAELVREQADRCRDILRSMGRAGKDDLHLKQSPLAAVVREAAEPHEDRGIRINYDVAPIEGAGSRQPVIQRRPEIIHGLRNLIQNAVDFAKEDIWIDIHWDETSIMVRIIDDGKGFPASVLGRIGDPYITSRPGGMSGVARPGYEGMGLGLFIAKTLLERSGAELGFANGSDPFLDEAPGGERSGAIVDATWPRAMIEVESLSETTGLGRNVPIDT
ncbi:sensor histidine kinase RegB [Ovoidimarina sediminis]|uniref:sensor histidine kinase RegB n=1 Tax=Ovoidimarina sediminis TaxID=3079856 RepID=UPI00290B70A1|nr:ActS/PrrB/RegB family redox-sensitive histidine kinase [Rhodophyticola sp. MJ-SS7]MDU8942514.1 ActS/PrrB/RegB family redox-sensitive histidine kinase [Rhodophyticola sp. MJ-SS7]